MKIVLVHPEAKIWTRVKFIPLGISYIAAYLEKYGFEVEIVDLNTEPEKKLPKADVVGITATTPLIKEAWRVAKEVKKKKSIVILGGPHVTALPEESAKLPFVDIVVRGEGEETMLKICQAIQKGRDFKKVLGISYRDLVSDKIFHNPPSPFIQDLDFLPFPAYHLYKLNLYTNAQPLISPRKPAASILTSRGCPYNCSFCYKGTFGQSWRARSPENVLAEWYFLVKKLKVKEIALMDDNFNIDHERAIKICRMIKKEGLVVPWRAHNGIRADLATEALLSAMKESGCYYVAFGVESGVQRILDIINKNLKLDEIKRAFRLAKKVGLKTMAFLMIGNPGETTADIQETIRFTIELDPDHALFSVATPFPGSRLYEIIKAQGKFKIKDWAAYSQFDQKGFFSFGDLDPETIQKMAKIAYRKFYLRPSYLKQLLSNSDTWKNIPNIIWGGLHYIFQVGQGQKGKR